jgi:hypothetical protein
MPYDEHLFPVEASHAADDSGIVGKTAITVDLAPIGEDAFHVVESVGALRMARHFSALPWIHVRRNFATKIIHTFVQLLHLTARRFVLSFESLETLDLLFDFFQFLLRFESRIHRNGVSIPAGVVRFHNREQKIGPDDGGMPGALFGMWPSGYFRSLHCRTC